jgi:hypothetical protein
MTTPFNTILPGSRWKAFLPRAALNGGPSSLQCGGASAFVAGKWSGRSRSRRGLPARPELIVCVLSRGIEFGFMRGPTVPPKEVFRDDCG